MKTEKLFRRLLSAPDRFPAVQLKTKEKDGYEAVVFGFGQKKEKNVHKAQRKLGNFAHLKEYRPEDGETKAELGSVLDVSAFNEGDIVEVSGISKGKGLPRRGQKTRIQRRAKNARPKAF